MYVCIPKQYPTCLSSQTFILSASPRLLEVTNDLDAGKYKGYFQVLILPVLTAALQSYLLRHSFFCLLLPGFPHPFKPPSSHSFDLPPLPFLLCPPSRCWHALWLRDGSSDLHLYSLSRSYLVPGLWMYLPKMTAKSLSLAWISPWVPNLPIQLLTDTPTLRSSYLRLNMTTAKLFT